MLFMHYTNLNSKTLIGYYMKQIVLQYIHTSIKFTLVPSDNPKVDFDLIDFLEVSISKQPIIGWQMAQIWIEFQSALKF